MRARARVLRPGRRARSGSSPKPEELAEASYAFAAKLLADQSRFMEELSKAMTTEEKHRD